MTVKKIFADDEFIDVSGSGYEMNGEFFKDNKKINIKEENFFEIFFNIVVLCNDANLEIDNKDNDTKIIGSGTESALLVLGEKAGISKEDLPFVRIEEIPFSSERKMMSVLCKSEKKQFVYSKGALEYLKLMNL